LLAIPLIAGLLTLGRECIHVHYAKGFDPAIPLLSWMVWAVFLRNVSWPMGYWLLARGSSRSVVIIETIASIISVLLPWVLIPSFGVIGAAIGFFVGYLIYTAIMLGVSRKRSGRWISTFTIGWVAFSAAVLWLSEFSVSCLDGRYWGLIPAGLLATLCAWI